MCNDPVTTRLIRPVGHVPRARRHSAGVDDDGQTAAAAISHALLRPRYVSQIIKEDQNV